MYVAHKASSDTLNDKNLNIQKSFMYMQFIWQVPRVLAYNIVS